MGTYRDKLVLKYSYLLMKMPGATVIGVFPDTMKLLRHKRFMENKNPFNTYLAYKRMTNEEAQLPV